MISLTLLISTNRVRGVNIRIRLDQQLGDLRFVFDSGQEEWRYSSLDNRSAPHGKSTCVRAVMYIVHDADFNPHS
jgi:hypothetical protein